MLDEKNAVQAALKAANGLKKIMQPGSLLYCGFKGGLGDALIPMAFQTLLDIEQEYPKSSYLREQHPAIFDAFVEALGSRFQEEYEKALKLRNSTITTLIPMFDREGPVK